MLAKWQNILSGRADDIDIGESVTVKGDDDLDFKPGVVSPDRHTTVSVKRLVENFRFRRYDAARFFQTAVLADVNLEFARTFVLAGNAEPAGAFDGFGQVRSPRFKGCISASPRVKVEGVEA
ncbi:hypothetical protein [Roseibium sediminicola]|uniref:Uncharacterized protein n=1 Tax=Roseibium sediminicola TaxID=2933272 RepID=A0ABT0H0K3_9HYPH|nr:hypothetical protein [Roseibium sp. CAU 1639]MCK7615213.1 hypothetical protein [Roseibium sp. CAU 1639]